MTHHMGVFEFARGLAMVVSAAESDQLPQPSRVEVAAYDKYATITLLTLTDLAAWARWAGIDVTTEEAREYLTGRWVLVHNAEGVRFEVPIRLTVSEYGVMAKPENYECSRCGAMFGHTGGFVLDEDRYDDHYSQQVAHHEAGDCTPVPPALQLVEAGEGS